MKTGKVFRRWIVYRLTLLGLFLAGTFDISSGRRLGAMLGRFAFYLIAGEREKAMSGVQIAFPEKTETERRNIAGKCFENLGKSFFEFVYYAQRPWLPLDDLITVEGLEHIDEAFSQGKGLIAVTAHIGSWELLGMYLARKGYPITAIAREVNNEGINRLMIEFRQKSKIATIVREKNWGTMKRLVQSLRDNRMLAVLVDQDARVPGVFVDFFGKPAKTPSGPISIALNTGAPVVTGFIVREANDRHRIIIKSIPIKKVGKKSDNVIYNTWILTRAVEECIRQYPDQWVWMHRRWKRKPKKDERSYPSQINPNNSEQGLYGQDKHSCSIL